MMRQAILLTLCLSLTACGASLFSRSNVPPSNRSPVIRIETLNGVEYGAATDHGLLMLGRTATEGACRVQYFLGRQLFTEDGTIEPAGGVFYRAEIDLKHQRAAFLGRDIRPDDELVAMRFDRDYAQEVPLELARVDGVEGDVAYHPGVPLEAGSPVFVRHEDGDKFLFVGLVAAEATLTGTEGSSKFVVFTGADRLRELLLVPERDPKPRKAKHRSDGISVLK